MTRSKVSYETRPYEVEPRLDPDGRLDDECAAAIQRVIDEHGFVVIPGLLSEQERAVGLDIIRSTIEDPDRTRSTFASATDIRHGRRDFCPLPSTEPVLAYASLLCRRLEGVLTSTCGRSRPILEISTLTSHAGCSHQYLHRDPAGVLCLFVAVEDVSAEQGGTLFAPGTHTLAAAERRFGGDAARSTERFQSLVNLGVFGRNLAKVVRMRLGARPGISWTEFRDRTCSRRWDAHQPNLVRFLSAQNDLFDISHLSPRNLVAMVRQGRSWRDAFPLVQACPPAGTVMVYRSDMLHAGPDNRSDRPRHFFNMNIARTDGEAVAWQQGYTPHQSLRDHPRTVGDLLDLDSP